MTAIGQDTLGTRETMNLGGKAIGYYSLKKAAAKLGDVSLLPFSMKLLLENLLRFDVGVTVTVEDIQALVVWLNDRRSVLLFVFYVFIFSFLFFLFFFLFF